MSKERAAAIRTILTTLANDDPQGRNRDEAIFTLIADGLRSLDRIATALEKPATIAPMGEGLVVGELAKFEPAIAPEQVAKIVEALEKIAQRIVPAGKL